jgi:hypothetical protein
MHYIHSEFIQYQRFNMVSRAMAPSDVESVWAGCSTSMIVRPHEYFGFCEYCE